jgi:hypothetical protein
VRAWLAGNGDGEDITRRRPRRESEGAIVCAWQRPWQEGSSPSGPRVRGSISKRGGNASRAREVILGRTLNGHEVGNDGDSQGDGPTGGLQPRRQPGGQGVGREAESEGHEEQFRAVIEGATPGMNRSAKAGARSSLHYGGEGVLTHPADHGAEDMDVTQGGLGGCHGEGPRRARTISEERSVRVGPSSRRRVAKYQKRRQQNLA